jgi:ferredoxin, 2Fe-2S
MPRIIFFEFNGTQRVIDAAIGQSVMDAAIKNGVLGIDAICGGSCACATCHVYLDSAWKERLPRMAEMEESMLESAHEPKENSRLSCQIGMSEELDGLVVYIPESQDPI